VNLTKTRSKLTKNKASCSGSRRSLKYPGLNELKGKLFIELKVGRLNKLKVAGSNELKVEGLTELKGRILHW
jgi:hypothetical protein